MANLFKIKEIARSKKISIKNLAESIGITEQGLQKLIRENSTKVETLESIALCLSVPISIFFDDKNIIAQGVDETNKYYLQIISSQQRTIEELVKKIPESIAGSA